MSFNTEFLSLEVSEITQTAIQHKEDGWRFVQILCTNTDEGIDVQYTYMKDGHLKNYTVAGVQKGTKLPSITDTFLAAFVFENESHDLFGVDIEGIAIDFKGNFYQVSEKVPMTIMSPEKKAAKEKAAKIAKAKAAKEKGKAEGTAKSDKDMADKMADMDPEKAAKVKAALEAKAKKEAAKKDAELAEKMANMDPEKAAKLQAALEAKAKKEAASKKEGE